MRSAGCEPGSRSDPRRGVLVNGVTAWIALRGLVRLQVTETVLLLGGGLGGVASRLAAVHPARQVIGVVGSDAKRVSAPAECTDIVLAADLTRAIDELTAGRGVDVVIDPVGGQLRRQAFAHLAPTKQVAAAGSAVVQLMDRGTLRAPAPRVLALSDVVDAHRALEDRAAPPKAVLALQSRG